MANAVLNFVVPPIYYLRLNFQPKLKPLVSLWFHQQVMAIEIS